MQVDWERAEFGLFKALYIQVPVMVDDQGLREDNCIAEQLQAEYMGWA